MLVERARTPDGHELTLHRRGDEHVIRVRDGLVVDGSEPEHVPVQAGAAR